MDCFFEDNADIGEARSEYLRSFMGYGVDSEVDCREKGVSDGDWELGIVGLGDLGMAFETGRSVVVVHRGCGRYKGLFLTVQDTRDKGQETVRVENASHK